MNNTLCDLLAKLDSSNEPSSEYNIFKLISKATTEPEDTSLCAKSENSAFFFREENTFDIWTPYFGHSVEVDSVVTKEVFCYWKSRAEKTENYLMKARYYGLVFDFHEKIMDEKVSYQVANNYVDSLLNVCQKGLCSDSLGEIHKIERAYRVSKLFNKPEQITDCIETAINIEERLVGENRFDQVGNCYAWFVEGKEKLLKDEQRDRILLNLEQIVQRIAECGDPFRTLEKGKLLAKYYRKDNKHDDVARIVNIISQCINKSCENQEAMTSSLLYQKLYSLYDEFDMKDEAESIAMKSAGIGDEIMMSMGKIPIPAISAEDLEFDLEGGVNDVFRRICQQFIVGKRDTEEQYSENQSVFDAIRTTDIIHTTICNYKGIPSVSDENFDPVINRASQIILSESPALYELLLKAIDLYHIDSEKFVDFIYHSLPFEESKKEIIQRGIQAFLDEDFLVAIHLLVPQIESAVHRLVNLNGGCIYEKNRHGGMQLKFFERLLSDEGITKYFDEDAIFYFKTMLTDQKAFNIRNDVCHGILPADRFGWFFAVRIVHVIICLSQTLPANIKTKDRKHSCPTSS